MSTSVYTVCPSDDSRDGWIIMVESALIAAPSNRLGVQYRIESSKWSEIKSVFMKWIEIQCAAAKGVPKVVYRRKNMEWQFRPLSDDHKLENGDFQIIGPRLVFSGHFLTLTLFLYYLLPLLVVYRLEIEMKWNAMHYLSSFVLPPLFSLYILSRYMVHAVTCIRSPVFTIYRLASPCTRTHVLNSK